MGGYRVYALVLGGALAGGGLLGVAPGAVAAPSGTGGASWLSVSGLVPDPSGPTSSDEPSSQVPPEPGPSEPSTSSPADESTSSWPSTCPFPDGGPWEPSPLSWDASPLGPSPCSVALGSWSPEIQQELAAIRVTVAVGLALLILPAWALLIARTR